MRKFRNGIKLNTKKLNIYLFLCLSLSSQYFYLYIISIIYDNEVIDGKLYFL